MARNAWRDMVTEAYTLARLAWEAEAEAATLGYATEMREYRRTHPSPRFRDFLVALRKPTPDDYV